MNDKVGKAIDTVEKTVQMISIPVMIGSTGRPVQLAVPADMTETELIEFVSWMTRELAGQLKANREHTAGGRIVIPGRAS